MNVRMSESQKLRSGFRSAWSECLRMINWQMSSRTGSAPKEFNFDSFPFQIRPIIASPDSKRPAKSIFEVDWKQLNQLICDFFHCPLDCVRSADHACKSLEKEQQKGKLNSIMKIVLCPFINCLALTASIWCALERGANNISCESPSQGP